MKRNLLSIIILALLVVNIVMTAVMMFTIVPANKKTISLVGDIASAMKLELSDPIYYQKYPTIYHLRRELMESKEKHDIRIA